MKEKVMPDIDTAQRQLDRVLTFFPRVEARIVTLFGVNTLMVVIAAINVSAGDLQLWYVVGPAILLLGGLLVSYFHLYHANSVELRGGEGSLIYFAEIRKRTEAQDPLI